MGKIENAYFVASYSKQVYRMATNEQPSTPTPKKNTFAEWLTSLQQESWQLELLISAFAIFGLIGIEQQATEWRLLIDSGYLDRQNRFVEVGIMIVGVGAILFKFNLLFHLFIRSFWIGAIGLRYVSGDIDYEKLNYSSIFTNFYRKKVGSFDGFIEQLEKLSSVLFSFTFLLFFMFISVFLFVSEVTFVLYLLKNWIHLPETLEKFIFLPLLLIGAITAIDFIFLGVLKKIKQPHFAKIYFWISRFVGIGTLAFLWRPILLNFLDTPYTKRLFMLAIPYLLVISFFDSNYFYESKSYYPDFARMDIGDRYNIVSNEEGFNFRYYDDEREKHEPKKAITYFSIPSKRVSGRVGEIFVRQHAYVDYMIEKKFSDIEPVNNYKELTSRQHLRASEDVQTFKQKEKPAYQKNMRKVKEVLQQQFTLQLDHQSIDETTMTCDFFQHSNAKERGLLCFFPLPENLSIGRHYYTLQRLLYLKEDHNQIDTIDITIPFIYEGK